MAPHSTIDERVQMLDLYKVCHNSRLVARSVNRSHSYVRYWVKRWENDGTIVRKVGTG
jgi:transposase